MPKDDKHSDTDLPTGADAEAAVRGWLAAFDAALSASDAGSAAALFIDDGHWRDVLAFDWDLATTSGRDAISARLSEVLAGVAPRNFRLNEDRYPPRPVMRAGVNCLEAFVQFESEGGQCEGVVRLVPGDTNDGGGFRCWVLMTALREIAGHGELLGFARPGGDAFSREWGGDNWLDIRERARAYEDRDPEALVVGGGQAGLAAAARLTHLGIDTLIVDGEERIGDNWRKRYHSLVLHNEVQVNHMPYMPFPPTWPVYIPKDLLANWFEHYVEALELNFWTGTRLTGGAYDDASGRWQVTLEKSDGSTRVMRPKHIVLATGVSAIPIMPDLPGLSEFKGRVMHSGAYTEGHEWKGKKVFVFGTGNSGHDVAHNLWASGADVTMVQRASTHIVSLAEAQKPYAIYNEGPSVDDCDLLAMSSPFPVLREGYRIMTAASKAVDKPLLDALKAKGFRLNDGVEDCGFQMSYLQRGGGYYFNVGASDLIAEGKIKVLDYAEIETFAEGGIRLNDGAALDADLVVCATGFKNLQDTARVLFGDGVAERIGPVWGFGEDGELRNMWRPTPQPGLWFIAGSLAQCRIYSKVLALQIKAREAGLIAQ
jgi:cation diffusion facilitator CzcD-associated flavoprotein CzcO